MTPISSQERLGFQDALCRGLIHRQSLLSGLPPRSRENHRAGNRGFTLVELLVVIAIIVVMMTLLVPSFTSIRGAGDLTKAAYDIAGTLSQARAYAMANNTYVFVGLQEVNASQNPGAMPQQSGTGSLVVAAIASLNGTRGYDVSSTNLSVPVSPVWTGLSIKNSFSALGKLQRFDNIHLAPPGVLNGGNGSNLNVNGGMIVSGNLTRPFVADDGSTTSPAVLVANQDAQSRIVTQFTWPLGTPVGDPKQQYNFTTVINFDPQGVARVQTKDNQDNLGQYLELGLMQTHGTVVTGTSNVAALQIDCITGANRIYRP